MNNKNQLSTTAAADGLQLGSGLRRIACLAALLVIFVASVRAQYPITETAFPDKNFYKVVLDKYSMYNGSVFVTNPGVTYMDVKSCNISDLTGIVYFPTLNTLVCSSNKLSSLILTGNTLLQTLDCSNNNLSSVNLSQNALLTTVTIYKNKLRGSSMDTFIQNLFDRSQQPTKGELRIIYNEYASTGNKMTSAQVEAAKKKGWTPKMSTNGSTWTDYPGSDAIAINATNFPDANFREWLLEQSYGVDGYLSTPEIAAVTKIDVSYESISSLKGIEYFTALKELECYNNQLTSLDVSNNTALTTLGCDGNKLTELDVSNNTALTYLYCNDNQLTSLDVSKNTALDALRCSNNQLTSLDVSNNTALYDLDCYNNQLTSLDVSGCTELTTLECYINQLTFLSVSGCTALTWLKCYQNQLTTLDVSGCTALTWLRCYNNQLTTLVVSNNTALRYLYCYENQIRGAGMATLINSLPEVTNGIFAVYDSEGTEGNEITTVQVKAAKAKGWDVLTSFGDDYAGVDPGIAIDATNFPDENFRNWLLERHYGEDGYLTDAEIANVKSIFVPSKNIASLKGIEYFTAMTVLTCSGSNQLTTLDLSNNTTLTFLNCGGSGQLTSLNVSGCTALETLECQANNMTSLNVSGCTALKTLTCYSNQLTTLDVSDCTALESLSCKSNQLTTLNVTKNTALTELDCGSNQLSTLDLSKNTALAYMYCYGNQLKSLDVSKNTALIELACGSNQLTELNVSKNTQLTGLACDGNQLKSLDVSKNTALKWLFCEGNELTSLDVSKKLVLAELWCFNNQIQGRGMTDLVNSLPDWKSASGEGQLYVYRDETPAGNLMTKVQVKIATDKNWNVQMWDEEEYDWVPYEGETPDGIEISEANFPDDNFRAYVSAKSIDKDEDGYLSPAEIAKVTTISVARKEIKSLKGIEYFTALTSLNCENNQLTELDVSNNTNLGYLICESNQLTELDVSNNTALVSLWCGYNPLVTLDVSKNTALTSLSCHSNGLTTLDVSNNTALTKLYCHMNQLSVLNVSNNTELEKLSCNDNQLTELDISKNTKLTELECYSNQLTSLDASGCSALTELYCSTNQLTSLNVSGCTALTELSCHENNIRGAAMNEFVNSLPTADAIMRVYYPGKARNNVITKVQVEIAKSKHWQVLAVFDGDYPGVTIPGDANGDGEVDAQDIATVRDYILGLDPQPFSFESANLNGDSEVDIQDLTLLIQLLTE